MKVSQMTQSTTPSADDVLMMLEGGTANKKITFGQVGDWVNKEHEVTSLETTSKTVAGAINEIETDVTDLDDNLTELKNELLESTYNNVLPYKALNNININGAKCSSNGDSIYSVVGTAASSGGRTIKLTDPITLPAGDYYFACVTTSTTCKAILQNASTNSVIAQNSGAFTLSEDTSVFIGINVSIDTTYDDTVKVLLKSGGTSAEWIPTYSARDTIARNQVVDLSKEVQSNSNAIADTNDNIGYQFDNLEIEGYTREHDNLLTLANKTAQRRLGLTRNDRTQYEISLDSTYDYWTIPVEPGEKYIVTGGSYLTIKCAVIIDANNTVIDYYPKVDSAEYEVVTEKVLIPDSAVTMFVVCKNDSTAVCYADVVAFKLANNPTIISGMEQASEFNELYADDLVIQNNTGTYVNDEYTEIVQVTSSVYTTYIIPVEPGEQYKVTGINQRGYKTAVVVDVGDHVIGYYPEVRSTTQTNPTTTFTVPANGVKMYVVRNKNLNFEFKRIGVPIYDVAERSSMYNPLYKKNLCTCGDSLTAAMTSTYDENFGYQNSYGWFVAKRNAMNYTNLGKSGETMCSTELDNGTVKTGFAESKYQDLPADTDIVTIFYGWNDNAYGPMQYKNAWCQQEYSKNYGDCTSTEKAACDAANDWVEVFIGEVADTTPNTWYGAWNKVLTYYRSTYPNLRIGIVIPYCEDVRLRTSLETICKLYGVSYVYGADPREWFSTGHSDGLSDAMSTYLRSTYTVDGLHPNELGHKMISYPYERWIRGL